MSEPGPKLWMMQVESDLTAANRVWDRDNPRTSCQVLAKYQQAVEKSVKAVVAAAKEFGVSLPPVGYRHDVSKHLEALGKLPRVYRGLQVQVDGLLTQYHRGEIAAISLLAPQAPATPQDLHRVNTEYPYEIAPGTWVAPAQARTFTESQVRRFSILAVYLFSGACKIISALGR